MNDFSLVLLLLATVAVLPAAAQDTHRQLDAHEHGHGTLNIALEGGRLVMELEVPGADIVGFEHAAKTKTQLEAVRTARQRLADPLQLFVLPAAADCILVKAEVEIEGGAERAEGDKGHGSRGKSGHKHDDAGSAHSEFHASYEISCKAPARLTQIDFAYFKVFKAAKELDVNLITSKGQTKFEATRKTIRLSLAGLI